MTFRYSDGIKITLQKEQWDMLQTEENIKICIGYPTATAFDIYRSDELIGFALLNEFDKGCYFLWDYAIGTEYQNRGFGTQALIELIEYMKNNYGLRTMTTTYIYGNTRAKHVYEKVGFVETDEVNNEQTHEVNMIFKLPN